MDPNSNILCVMFHNMKQIWPLGLSSMYSCGWRRIKQAQPRILSDSSLRWVWWRLSEGNILGRIEESSLSVENNTTINVAFAKMCLDKRRNNHDLNKVKDMLKLALYMPILHMRMKSIGELEMQVLLWTNKPSCFASWQTI